jgi:ElaB/YqjD/DUF883 family membrane-anchored ribosome-binding protein
MFDEPKEEENVNNDISNVAVATSSPFDEDDFDNMDRLPKVERPAIVQPNININDRIIPVENKETNDLYDSVPNIMDNIKEDIKTSNEIKEETQEFVDSIPKTVVSREKAEEIKQKLNSGINVYSEPVKEVKEVHKEYVEPVKEVVNNTVNNVSERPNVNISADNVAVKDNVISDDEFFDDFFGDE